MTPLDETTQRLLETLAGSDLDARLPSLLPGWTAGHVLTHIARNGDGFRHMLEGAAVGEVRDQYPRGREGRQADIEAGARRSTEDIVEDVRASAGALDAAILAMPDDAWDRLGRTFAGTVPARTILVSRRREVEVHHADLGLAYRPVDWPPDFVAAEFEAAVGGVAQRLPPSTSLQLTVSQGRHLTVDIGDGPRPIGVAGPAPWLLWWLMGRPVPEGVLVAPEGLPQLGAWG